MTSSEIITDPASDIVNDFSNALRMVFDPASESPPDGGGSTTVHFFGGDAIPLAAWDAHNDGDDCTHPMLWVRLARRYRSETFPAPAVSAVNCGIPRSLAMEIGVARCAVIGAEVDLAAYSREAEISLDDSWRIEMALCVAGQLAKQNGHAISYAVDTIVPYGPDGGVVAWVGTAYVQI